MKRLILTIALLSSFTIPAAASFRNGLAEVRPHSERSATAHTSKLRRTAAEVRKDPYWEPCSLIRGTGALELSAIERVRLRARNSGAPEVPGRRPTTDKLPIITIRKFDLAYRLLQNKCVETSPYRLLQSGNGKRCLDTCRSGVTYPGGLSPKPVTSISQLWLSRLLRLS